LLVRADPRADPMTAPRTHRPLPDDPGIAVLGEAERIAIAEAWRSRSRNELSTSTVFAEMARALVGFEAPHAFVREAADAVADEVRHAELCMHVARAYWPSCAPPEASPVVAPAAYRGDPRFATLLFVVMQSCINEGVAAAYLQRCLDEATGVLARAAVRDIFEDEVHHARLGWSLLASPLVAPAWRADLGEALPALLAVVADAWVAESAVDRLGVPRGHGTLPHGALGAVVRQAFEELIVPGFDRLQIDTSLAREWIERRWTPGS
jgi:hypothetical protein